MAHHNAPRVETFGCRLNIWESEVVRDQAATAGLNDAIIFNTCAVTAEAERQARQAIRRARRDDPDARIINRCHGSARAVRRVVVDDYDLLDNISLIQCRSHRIYDRRFLVLRGDEHGDARWLRSFLRCRKPVADVRRVVARLGVRCRVQIRGRVVDDERVERT